MHSFELAAIGHVRGGRVAAEDDDRGKLPHPAAISAA